MNNTVTIVEATPEIDVTPGPPLDAHISPELCDVLNALCDFLRDYVVFAHDEQVIPIALWIAHTYAIDASDYTPYLHIYSPEKRCGKSRLLDCLKALVRKPWHVVSPTEAVLFRYIDLQHPTLLLDEIDTMFPKHGGDRAEFVRALLNAGFERKATVPRCSGDHHDVREFTVFCPKALAGIGDIPETIKDRCIPIRLKRRSHNEMIRQFRAREVDMRAKELRRRLQNFAENSETPQILRDARPRPPKDLGDRQLDICEPLLAIADMAGAQWPHLTRVALEYLFNTDQEEDQSYGVKLLRSIKVIFEEQKCDRIPTDDLLAELTHQEGDLPWAAWWSGDLANGRLPSVANKLARLLKPYGITPRVFRDGQSTQRGYLREDFNEPFERYVSDSETGVTPQQPVSDDNKEDVTALRHFEQAAFDKL